MRKDEGGVEMLKAVDEPPPYAVAAVVPKPTATVSTQNISPLFLACFPLGVPNHLMARDPLHPR